MVRYRNKTNYSRNNLMNRDRVNAYRNRKRILRNVLNNTALEINFVNEECELPTIADNFHTNKTIRELLRSWVNCHGVTTRAVNDLLKILLCAGVLSHFFFVEIFVSKHISKFFS